MTSMVERFLMAICAALIVAMVALMNVEVAARYLFGASTKISEEYSSYLFCAATMAGFYPALVRSRFLRITTLLSFLPLRIRAAWEAVIAVASGVFCLLLARECWGLFSLSRQLGSISEQYSETPLMYPQLILPVGLVVLAVGMVVRGIQLARDLWRGDVELLRDESNVLE